MNTEQWKNIEKPVNEKVTCMNPKGSGTVNPADYIIGGCCRFCFFKGGDFISPKCNAPVQIPAGHTVRYRETKQVQYLKKVVKVQLMKRKRASGAARRKKAKEDDYDTEYEYCDDCGGEKQWCTTCQMWTQICCVEYGTCMCSQGKFVWSEAWCQRGSIPLNSP